MWKRSILTKFACNFTMEFCDKGEINWKKIVEFNAQKKQIDKK